VVRAGAVFLPIREPIAIGVGERTRIANRQIVLRQPPFRHVVGDDVGREIRRHGARDRSWKTWMTFAVPDTSPDQFTK